MAIFIFSLTFPLFCFSTGHSSVVVLLCGFVFTGCGTLYVSYCLVPCYMYEGRSINTWTTSGISLQIMFAYKIDKLICYKLETYLSDIIMRYH